MNNDLLKMLDEILPLVESPGRYIGNEVNSIVKEITHDTIRYAFAFPDIYEVGMSHLGTKILYHLLNEQEDVYCERVFAPWLDMEKQMRDHKIPLFSLETKNRLDHFDFIGFTLQYEMSYTNILNMLDLAGIPLYSKDRNEDHPIVMMGGPCAFNSEPLAAFADIIVIGEGEEVILDILNVYKQYKNAGKKEILKRLMELQGVYIPSFYDVKYGQDGSIMEVIALEANAPLKIKKRYIENMDDAYFPDKVVVPYIQAIHDRVVLEVFRGCTRGCRFCQAGMIYRPVREKSPERLQEDARKLLESTGCDEISLSSLSTTDYSQLEGLVDHLIDHYEDKRISISLPSLRIDSFSIGLADKIQKVRKSGLTFAPEAGTQRLRDVINKGVCEEDLLDAVGKAFEAGWGHVKLYFMIGLPTETMEDIEGIAVLTEKVLQKYYETQSPKKNRSIKIVVSTSSFVPKAFTPFQWETQNTIDETIEKQKYLKARLKSKKISYNWHESSLSILEGVFARGDRRLCDVLYGAWKRGCKFDGWHVHFKYDAWLESFQEYNIDPKSFVERKRTDDEILPWDMIDSGVSKGFLIEERNKAYEQSITDHCRNGCANCGITDFAERWVCNDCR